METTSNLRASKYVKTISTLKETYYDEYLKCEDKLNLGDNFKQAKPHLTN